MTLVSRSIRPNTILLLATAMLISACSGGPGVPPLVEDQSSAPIEREVATSEGSEDIPAPTTSAATNALLLAAQSALSSDEPKTAVA